MMTKFLRYCDQFIDLKSIRRGMHFYIEGARENAVRRGSQNADTLEAIFEAAHAFVDDTFTLPEHRNAHKRHLNDLYGVWMQASMMHSAAQAGHSLGVQVKNNLEWQKAYEAWNELCVELLNHTTSADRITGAGGSSGQYPTFQTVLESSFIDVQTIARAMEKLDTLLSSNAKKGQAKPRLGETPMPFISYMGLDPERIINHANRVSSETKSKNESLKAQYQALAEKLRRGSPEASGKTLEGLLAGSMRGHQGEPVASRVAGQEGSAGDGTLHQQPAGDVGVRGSGDGAGVNDFGTCTACEQPIRGIVAELHGKKYHATASGCTSALYRFWKDAASRIGMGVGCDTKYVVTKADGSPVDPKADYLVLRLDTDPCARDAASLYARSLRTYKQCRGGIDEATTRFIQELHEKCNRYYGKVKP